MDSKPCGHGNLAGDAEFKRWNHTAGFKHSAIFKPIRQTKSDIKKYLSPGELKSHDFQEERCSPKYAVKKDVGDFWPATPSNLRQPRHPNGRLPGDLLLMKTKQLE
jgi:hypothetical protein